MINTTNSHRVLILAACICVFAQSQLSGQVRSGLGYLKLTPGARQVGMAGSMTGNLDYTDSFYANPAATGFMREWQWSATYTSWISDVYNASLLYGRRVRTPWSRSNKLVLGASYLGIREFDSSDGAGLPVSGNNFLATMSYGLPVSFISRRVSLGGNVKYFRSELAGFDANAIIFDAGLLYKTRRFRFLKAAAGFLDDAILSAGLSLANIGRDITFLSESTPLPRILRAGVALNFGTHRGLQWSLATDYHKVRDETGFISLGAELSWSQLLAVRWGYSFEENLLGNFTFGASMSLDDRYSPVKHTLPGRNNSLRVDIAANQKSNLTSAPFHGSVSQFPIAPERFDIVSPNREIIHGDSLVLRWRDSVDRDLYDNVSYWVIIDSDSLKVAEIAERARNAGEPVFDYLSGNGTLEVSQQLSTTEFVLSELSGGSHYWCVLAFDKDRHVRVATMKTEDVVRFDVTVPDLRITSIQFGYSPWITQDDTQGILKFKVKNVGERASEGYQLAVFDSSRIQLSSTSGTPGIDEMAMKLLGRIAIPDSEPGAVATVNFEWRATEQGRHRIVGEIVPPGITADEDSAPHRLAESFYTIPKGTFATYDTVLTQAVTNTSYELPYVGRVFFDSTSSEVNARYTRNWIVEPLLATLANRLRANPSLTIELEGTADSNSGELDYDIAIQRAVAVRDTLIRLGVNREQLDVLPGVVLPQRKLPKDMVDSQRLLQERRRVEIKVNEATERELFAPLRTHFNERIISPVNFFARVASVLPLQNGNVLVQADGLLESVNIHGVLGGVNLDESILWEYHQTSINENEDWQNTDADYSLELTDSLGRHFKTQPKTVFLETKSSNRQRMYVGIAKFGVAEPLYSFYWDNLMMRVPKLLKKKDTRLRFVGHACAIGPEAINMTLSKRRGLLFYKRFLADVETRYPELAGSIIERVDRPEGFGETQPFSFKGRKGEVFLLGDNALPGGRQLNRRIMAVIYSAE